MRPAFPASLAGASSNVPLRRNFLKYTGGIAAALSLALARAQGHRQQVSNKVELPPDHPNTEAPEKTPEPSLPPNECVGYAVVGVGRLTVAKLLPGLVKCKYSGWLHSSAATASRRKSLHDGMARATKLSTTTRTSTVSPTTPTCRSSISFCPTACMRNSQCALPALASTYCVKSRRLTPSLNASR